MDVLEIIISWVVETMLVGIVVKVVILARIAISKLTECLKDVFDAKNSDIPWINVSF